MRKRTFFFLAVLLVAIAAGVSVYSQSRNPAVELFMPAGASYRILLGVGDREPTAWDGSISMSPGKIEELHGWRFAGEDAVTSPLSWKASTRRIAVNAANGGPMAENGVIFTTAADDPNSTFEVKTVPGNFSFKGAEISWGAPKTFLDGRVQVDRVPNVVQLTNSPDDQDFPAAAQSFDAVWTTFVEFAHADREQEGNRPFKEEPKKFDYLARPAGGDQVFLMRYGKQRHNWSAPVPVTGPKQDIARTAVAVDKMQRVWVFWSANVDGNFDIYAKSLNGGKWSRELRITSDPGPDVNPVATTDAQGRVWVAWQGYRNHNLEVLAAVENGEIFTTESVVSFSNGSDWDPALAAAPNGEVAVAWDTYDKGDYDVYFRRLHFDKGIKMDPPVPVAASTKFEARASAAYDSQNRLWVAYEASESQWGKDWGAYETSGTALYQGHTARIKCFRGNQALAPAGDLDHALPGPSAYQAGGQMARAGREPRSLALPNPELVKDRAPSGTPVPPPLPKNSFPRLALDGHGTVYLTFRTPSPGRSPLGTIWTQNVAYLDGDVWKGPITVPNTDYWMDVRSVITPVDWGDLLMISVSDHRQMSARGLRVSPDLVAAARPGEKRKERENAQAAGLLSDTYNADLYAAEFRFGQTKRALTQATPGERVAAPDPVVAPEHQQVKLMRDHRASVGSERLQLMRGEFHRHTEISGDGGNDGPLVDAYRYMIDAASMDWGGCCDHDNGSGREYPWWLIQKYTDMYHLPGTYLPMFAYERSVQYPEGHRNVVFPTRGIRPLPRLPLTAPDSAPNPAPDTQMLYRYLKQFGGIVASHTSGTNMGTDWRDNDPQVEPVVEIYQGDRQNYEMPDAPRANSANDSIGGWRPLGFVSLALKKGYRLGFQASSDHISTHMSYCNLWVTAPTREAVMEAFHKRRVYGATDNILADVRCQGHFMGEEFTTSEAPALSVKLWGTGNFAKVQIIKDSQYVYSVSPGKRIVDFSWKDTAPVKGKTSYYYVRGEQADGELVWVSPMWITYQ